MRVFSGLHPQNPKKEEKRLVFSKSIFFIYILKEKIFEPFYRIKETEKQKGTGIGLALSRSLAQLHNGSLVLEPENEWNVFTLTLPIHQEIEFTLTTRPQAENSATETNFKA